MHIFQLVVFFYNLKQKFYHILRFVQVNSQKRKGKYLTYILNSQSF